MDNSFMDAHEIDLLQSEEELADSIFKKESMD